MQPREKQLALIIGLLCAGLLVFFGIRKIAAAYTLRDNKSTELTGLLNEQEAKIAAGNRARAKQRELKARSLPGDMGKALSRYQSWLLARSEASQWQDVDVRSDSKRASPRVYQPLAFTVTARATLPQLVAWLHDFYRTGHLHLIRRLTVTPIDKSKLLALDIGVEAITLPGAEGAAQPPERTDMLARGKIDDYRRTIEGRNIFGPRNRPPAMEATTRVPGKLGQPVTFTAKAKDPDSLDKVVFKLVGDAPVGATLDAMTGKFSWKPPADQKPGEVKLQIAATDDGLPAATVSQTVTISIEKIGVRLAALGDQKIEAGKPLLIAPRLAEHEPSLAKSFALEGDLPDGMTFDAKTGSIKWTPGLFDIGKDVKLTLAVSDSASPPNRDEKQFAISVVEPKIEPIALDFNARHTYLTGIVEANGSPEAWLLVRPTGETLKLAMPAGTGGPPTVLKAGKFTATLIEVGKDAITLETAGRRLTVYLGKSLGDAVDAQSSP